VRRQKRDIASVDELVSSGLLRALPPDPFGAGWELDATSGQIVSKQVRYRYGVKIDPASRAMLERFRVQPQQAN
jgi:hypothetical protein